MAGKRPFSSQAWKKNVQSMLSRSSAIEGAISRVPRNGGGARSCASQLDRGPVGAGGGQRKQGLSLLLVVERAEALLVGAVVGVEGGAAVGVEQVLEDADDA